MDVAQEQILQLNSNIIALGNKVDSLGSDVVQRLARIETQMAIGKELNIPSRLDTVEDSVRFGRRVVQIIGAITLALIGNEGIRIFHYIKDWFGR